MELQGKKATHDFLSLYKDSSYHPQDSRPPSQGLYLKTHDFLQPLERIGRKADGRVVGAAIAEKPPSVEHVLPGGIGTYSISHVSGFGSRAVVKPERATCAVVRTCVAERKPEPSSNGHYNPYNGGAFTLWEESVAKDTGSTGQSPSPFATRSSSSFGSLSPYKNHPAQDNKRFMDSASKSSKGFADDDEDDEEDFGRRESSSQKGELTIKVDGKNNDQRASTPRSKHSATEQRRRSKINDRFQILRDLIPQNDQKRDKASFLLEVIQYIQFLQEKVQKYESSSYPEWNQESAKLMPWKNSQGPGDGIADLSEVVKNGPAPPGFMLSGIVDNSIPVAPTIVTNAQNLTEPDNMGAGISYKAMGNPPGFTSKEAAVPITLQPNLYTSVGKGTGFAHTPQGLISDLDNMASQPQPQWLRSLCLGDCTSSDMLNEQELAIDEGTISVSNAYSQGLLTTLTQALESSGIDLSQASISVQINLGKRAINRRPTTPATMSSAKDHDEPSSGNRAVGHSRVESSGEESEQAPKRHKPDYS